MDPSAMQHTGLNQGNNSTKTTIKAPSSAHITPGMQPSLTRTRLHHCLSNFILPTPLVTCCSCSSCCFASCSSCRCRCCCCCFAAGLADKAGWLLVLVQHPVAARVHPEATGVTHDHALAIIVHHTTAALHRPVLNTTSMTKPTTAAAAATCSTDP